MVHPGYFLAAMLLFVIIVTICFMSPQDRRVFVGIVAHACGRMWDEFVYQLGRAKRWYDERRAAKQAATTKSYGGS